MEGGGKEVGYENWFLGADERDGYFLGIVESKPVLVERLSAIPLLVLSKTGWMRWRSVFVNPHGAVLGL